MLIYYVQYIEIYCFDDQQKIELEKVENAAHSR